MFCPSPLPSDVSGGCQQGQTRASEGSNEHMETLPAVRLARAPVSAPSFVAKQVQISRERRRRIFGEDVASAAATALPERSSATSFTHQLPRDTEASQGFLDWDILAWVRSLAVHEVVGNALRAAKPAGVTDIEFVMHATREHLELALRGRIEEVIIELLWRGVQNADEPSSEGEDSRTWEKYESGDDLQKLEMGNLASFYGGLEAKLGSPHPNLSTAMEAEHTQRADCLREFTNSNYGITTTSKVEWLFVTQPESAPTWPQEAKLLVHVNNDTISPAAEQGTPGAANSRWSRLRVKPRLEQRIKMRKPMPTAEMRAVIKQRNTELAAIGETSMLVEEGIGARLYTGPMFVKYNTVLRSMGGGAATAAKQLLHGNLYTTTLHVISSSIVKLSKLTRAVKVYRGISGMALPEAFHEANQYGVRGGVEPAFMSTTCDRDVALAYARSRGRASVIFEIQQGMVDRGADMRSFSQYPFEEEIVFSPLTSLEVLGTHIEGRVLVVEARTSINLVSPTIEQVFSRRQRLVANMCEQMALNLRDELGEDSSVAAHELHEGSAMARGSWEGLDAAMRGFDVRAHAMATLDGWLQRCLQHEPAYYNGDGQLGEAIQLAVRSKQAVSAWPAGLVQLEMVRGTPAHDDQGALRYGGQGLGDGGVGALALMLLTLDGNASRPVDALFLHMSAITDIGLCSLAHSVKHGALQRCQHLELGINEISDVGVGGLVDALASQGAADTLRVLSLGENHVTGREFCRLRETALPALLELHLDENCIDDDGLAALSEGLCRAAASLAVVYLFRNKIADMGVRALATAISNGAMPRVRELWLGENAISDDGATALREALLSGLLPNCCVLELNFNRIGTAAAEALEEAWTSRVGAPLLACRLFVHDAPQAEACKQYVRDQRKGKTKQEQLLPADVRDVMITNDPHGLLRMAPRNSSPERQCDVQSLETTTSAPPTPTP